MDNLWIFKYEESNVRVVIINNTPWWVAKDVCGILGLANVGEAIKKLDDDELTSEKMMSGGQLREMKFINEPGLYSLILRSNKMEAKKFKRWVTHEVLPTIRKTGGYVSSAAGFVNNYFPDMPDDAKNIMIQTLDSRKKLLMEQERLLDVNEKLLIQQKGMTPKVEFYNDVTGSRDAVEMSKVAKVLDVRGMGRNNLFQFLRDQKVLRFNNEPYQFALDRGYFRTIEQKWMDAEGVTHISIKTLVYQKGLDFIRKLIKKEEEQWGNR